MPKRSEIETCKLFDRLAKAVDVEVHDFTTDEVIVDKVLLSLGRIPRTADDHLILPGDDLHWALYSGVERVRVVNVGIGEVEFRCYKDGKVDEVIPFGGKPDDLYYSAEKAADRAHELANHPLQVIF